jgi:magnesium transporter
MSNVSNKMNEVMKVLTIMASIFIPLTFIAGIYGMNFEYMPELQWQFGYFVVLGLMLSILVIMLLYFKRKRWI